MIPNRYVIAFFFFNIYILFSCVALSCKDEEYFFIYTYDLDFIFCIKNIMGCQRLVFLICIFYVMMIIVILFYRNSLLWPLLTNCLLCHFSFYFTTLQQLKSRTSAHHPKNYRQWCYNTWTFSDRIRA